VAPEHEGPDGYRIERVLGGCSGVSTVYAAAGAGGAEVALRVYSAGLSADGAFRTQFARTVRAHASLEHPNLVRVVDSSVHPQRQGRQDDAAPLFVALELIDGATLAERVAFAALPIEPTLRMSAKVAEVLEAAGRLGVTHRRLGTQAIMLHDDDVEEPVLSDFGVGWDAEGPVPAPDPGRLLGDTGALAPEEIRGETPDARSTVYALGAIVFECLAGVAPFTADSRAERLHAHLTEPPPWLGERALHVPREVGDVLGRAMAKAPRERQSGPQALVAELERALGR